MDIKDLQFFVAVYEANGFTRASQQLHTVQSNVSARIGDLERFLGVALFERRYRSVVPTENAERLYQHAKDLLASFALTKEVIRQPEQGFTLIELLVVVVIIGLLAGFVAPRYFSQVGKSEVSVAKAQIDALQKALDTYRLDTGHYPSTELGLAALATRPPSEPRWSGPYLRKDVPLDPWGKPYVYKVPGEKGDFDLLSYGKDGQPGGTGESADITN